MDSYMAMESSFGSIARTILREWRIVATVCVVFELLALVFLRFATPVYSAEMVVAPASDNSLGSSLGTSLGQLSGLASVAGIRLPDNENVTPYSKFVELTQSDELADRIERKYGLLKYLYSSRWDWQKHQWKEAVGPVSAVRSALFVALDKPVLPYPTSANLAKLLKERVSVDIVGRTGMRRISFVDEHRWFAKFLLNAIYQEADEILRDDALNRAHRQIGFLRNRLEVVTIAEERAALSNLLLQQEQQEMLANSGLAYSAHLVEPPFASEIPVWPRPVQFLAVAFVLGLIAGAGAAFMRVAKFPREHFRLRPFGLPTRLSA
jgi:uncharacterized protein involved in exopolysaccharide biosynthesis